MDNRNNCAIIDGEGRKLNTRLKLRSPVDVERGEEVGLWAGTVVLEEPSM